MYIEAIIRDLPTKRRSLHTATYTYDAHTNAYTDYLHQYKHQK